MRRFLLGALAVSLSATLVLACGGQTSGINDAGADGKVGDGGIPVGPGDPPPIPNDAGPATSTVATFALHTIYFGEADRNGIESTNAWKDYGFNLDGIVTDKTAINVCTLASNAPKQNQVDGLSGIDNAWGSLLLPIVISAASIPTPSTVENQAIDDGTWTVQLQITGLSNDPKQTAIGLNAQIFSSGVYDNGTPAFDGTTDWPVLSTSVKDQKTIASGSTAVFGSAYITNGTFVSGKGADPLVLPLNINGVSLTINVHDAIITFDHTAPGSLTNGTIAGVVDDAEFVAALQKVAGQISTTLCGTAFNGIADQIKQAADILDDGTNASGTPCTGISIGIGFDALQVANPTHVVPPPDPPADPCL